MTEKSTNTPQAPAEQPVQQRQVSTTGQAVTAALLAALAGGGATYLMSGSSENPLETPAQARKRKLKNALFGSVAAGGAYALADAATGNAVTNTLRGVFAGPQQTGDGKKNTDRKNMGAVGQVLVGGTAGGAGALAARSSIKSVQDDLAANQHNRAVQGGINQDFVRAKILHSSLGSNDPSLRAIAALEGGPQLISVLSQGTPDAKQLQEAAKLVSQLKLSPNASPEARAIWKSWGGKHDAALKDALNMLSGVDASDGEALAKAISRTYARPSRIGPGTTRLAGTGLGGFLAALVGLSLAPHFTGKDTIVTSGGEPIEKFVWDD